MTLQAIVNEILIIAPDSGDVRSVFHPETP